MNPAAAGNASGLVVSCTFDPTGVAAALTITDYPNAVWHFGAARNVHVTVARTASSTAGKTTIKSRPTNNTAVASCVNIPAGQTGIPAGNLEISAADINRSVEKAVSTTTLTGSFINPGTFIKSVVATGSGCTKVITVTLSKATLAGGPLCPASPGPTTGNCTNSVGAPVLVSNDTGRTVTNGKTTAGSGTVTSASAHFCAPTFFAGASTNVAANTVTKAGHVLANGDKVRLTGLTTTTGVTNNTTYFVVTVVAGSSFKVALTAGGAARDLTGSNQAGTVTVGPATPECGSAATQQTDVGNGISGGNLPDGATVATVNSVRSVTAVCTGCVGGFTGVTTSSSANVVISLSPANPPTSSRFVTVGSATGTSKVLTAGTAEFAKTDVGLPIVFVPPIANQAGARVASVAADGSSATLATPANIPAGAKKFVIGLATKTAPASGDTAGTIALLLRVNPTVSPTSPPCAAAKTSGFQIPLAWRNPQGTAVAPATNTAPAAGYNMFIGGNHFNATSAPAVSIAQLNFRTASTSFSGYLQQVYTTTAGVNGPSTYRVNYTFLPVTIGVCPGTGTANTWNFSGLSKRIAENPSFTGGGGGGLRGIGDEPQGTSEEYVGQPLSATSGAYVTTGAGALNQPTNDNSCTISSPAAIQIGC